MTARWGLCKKREVQRDGPQSQAEETWPSQRNDHSRSNSRFHWDGQIQIHQSDRLNNGISTTTSYFPVGNVVICLPHCNSQPVQSLVGSDASHAEGDRSPSAYP